MEELNYNYHHNITPAKCIEDPNVLGKYVKSLIDSVPSNDEIVKIVISIQTKHVVK